jgi:hypothetical protein
MGAESRIGVALDVDETDSSPSGAFVFDVVQLDASVVSTRLIASKCGHRKQTFIVLSEYSAEAT